MSLSLRCEHLVTSDGVLTDAVVDIDGATIGSVRAGADAEDRADRAEDEQLTGWVLPGFVDTHTHGAGGDDLASADPDQVRRAVAFARRRGGTTTQLASLVTAPMDRLVEYLHTLAPLVAAGEIAGIHLEGPFLSYAKRGAHDPDRLRSPDAEAVDRLLEAADGRLSMITIAPELPGAIEAIERFVTADVRVAIGHTDGDDRPTRAALDAGATVATHLFNAMRPIHHRDPGPIPALLTDDRVLVELVCDGAHVHPDVLRMAIDAAGPERVALITDSMLATGMSDGEYRLGDLDVAVVDGVARLRTEDGSHGSIAGSTLTMAAAFAFCVQRLGLSIPDVAVMAATTPARWHRLDASHQVGEIRPGRRADLAVVDDHGNLQRLMVGGQWEELA